jgi:hypothetical protein
MHPPHTRETIQATRTEAKHGVRGAADIDRRIGNAVAACAYNEPTPVILNDADHWLFVVNGLLFAARHNDRSRTSVPAPVVATSTAIASLPGTIDAPQGR